VERFPVARTVEVGERESLVIDEGGSSDGYVLYEGGTIDASGDDDGNAITITASYVILRGLTIRGGRNAIYLDGAHDVVIEQSDISGFGEIEEDGWGANEDAGVRCREDERVERIVVQRNHIHHPRSDSNSWAEYRESIGSAHPMGAQAIQFDTCGGNHVFRYNDVYSDDDHMFQDGMGGAENFSDWGFPAFDTDIYANRISHCWDDAIESEGANENVRIWGNYLDRIYVPIAVATTSVGPLYVFRNVANENIWGPDSSSRDSDDHGPFMKAGGHDDYFGGRIYVFHNTTLQPREDGAEYGIGVGGGIADAGAPRLEQIVSRNNIFYLHKDWWAAISDDRASRTNDFDFDLYNGNIDAYEGAEPNGIHDAPIFVASFMLDPSSPGFDEGVPIPGFNDDFEGAGPEMGAQEAGAPPLEFGVDAYRGTTPEPGRDGGSPDGDAGPSSGDRDAARGRDAGSGAPPVTSACGCSAARPSSAGAWLVVATLWLLWRRRAVI
jgi:hypothetical protein